jgi:hypothetical protein
VQQDAVWLLTDSKIANRSTILLPNGSMVSIYAFISLKRKGEMKKKNQ